MTVALLILACAVALSLLIIATGIAIHVARHRMAGRFRFSNWPVGVTSPFVRGQNATIVDDRPLIVRCWSCTRESAIETEALPIGAAVTFVCTGCAASLAAKSGACNG